MVRPLVACVGGFLGAGKTTALLAAARELVSRGKRVSIITNDQGSQLVDTAFLRDAGLSADEVTGGCFCCRFDELVETAGRTLDSAAPDVIFAEAVGSCTDLAATVLRPLRWYYADRFDLAPLSVFVEPERLRAEAAGFPDFPDSVGYLFDKQLAEADLIVLNKVDLLGQDESLELRRLVEERFEGAPVQFMSALSGRHVAEWVDRLLGAEGPGERVQDVDYVVYAEAEAALGWLNATVDVSAAHDVLPVELGEWLVESIRRRSVDAGAAIAHLKVLVATGDGSDRIALTDNAGFARWSGAARLGPARDVSLIVNARVRTSPETLERLVRESVADAAGRFGAGALVQHLESFSPDPPRPVHRSPGQSEIERHP
jgi:Ni2+-binding GTPase involved in maturation of urease and hydrogenase